MKLKSLFIITLILLPGCSQQDSVGIQYMGTYSTTVEVLTSSGAVFRTTTADITFKKGSLALGGGELTLVEKSGEYNVDVTGRGPTFALTRHSVSEDVLGNKDVLMRQGTGEFNGTSVTMTTYDDRGIKAIYKGQKQ